MHSSSTAAAIRAPIGPVERRSSVKRTLFAAAIAAAVLAPALGLARGPSTPAERKRAVETTRRLERDPLGKTANADRRWLFQWIVEIPDIQVRLCATPLETLVKDDLPNGKILYAQDGFGMAAFLIENPKKEDDWVGVQAAGLESVIRAYESILKKHPDARIEVLDTLVQARKAGKLRAVVQGEMKSCDPESMGPVPDDSI
jgi:hypothetical protein